MAQPPPTPSHLLRSHSSPVNALWLSGGNDRLYSGDTAGTITITSTRTLRSITAWKAHEDSILGVQEWEDSILTHGRDNKLHVWSTIRETAARVREAAAQPGLPTPSLRYSMDVNALNYCRFSLMPLPGDAQREDTSALIALPNLVESSLADIWALPSKKRLHAAVGKEAAQSSTASIDGRVGSSTGIIMSLHLFSVAHPHVSERTQLRLLLAYENGSVALRAFTRTDKETSVEGIGWDVLWSSKLHVESVMAMAVPRDNSFALTVSADHLIGRYDIARAEQEDVSAACVAHRTKYAGNASIAIRDDGRVCAVGGWDGKIRLYSTKSLKPLGTLAYHKKSVQALVFAHSIAPAESKNDEDDSDEDMSLEEKEERGQWLVSGSQDSRVSIWSLISFGR